jgi:hypothetical protein
LGAVPTRIMYSPELGKFAAESTVIVVAPELIPPLRAVVASFAYSRAMD